MAAEVVADLGSLLVTLGLGTLSGAAADTFYNQRPTTPAVATSLRAYGGAEGDRALGYEGVRLEFPRVQILRRDPSAAAAFNRLYAIYVALGKVVNQTVNGTRYLRIQPLQQPFFLMNEESTNRPIYCFNVELEKERTA